MTFIRNGDRPIEYIRLIIDGVNHLFERLKCTKLLLEQKCMVTHTNAVNWPHTEANAAPAIPQSSTYMNKGHNMMFTPTESNAEIMAFLG